MSGHADIAPSSLYRTVACPGWIVLTKAAPPEALHADQDGDAASEEGTAAHWALAEMVLGRLPTEGDLAPNGVALTEEMLDAVDVGFDAVRRICEQAGVELRHVAVEKPVAIRRVHERCWGTPDFRFWVGHHLHVLDYKHGFGIVEAFENHQLVAYTAGAIEERQLHDSQVTVTNTIIQPRAPHREGPVRSWTYPATEIRGMLNLMANAAEEALGPNPQVRAGSGCRYCPARAVCPSLARSTSDVRTLAHAPLPHVLSPAAVSLELLLNAQALRMLKARVEALEVQAMALARAGKSLPHHLLQTGASRVKWTKPDAEVIALGQMLGLPLAKAPAAITPSQALAKGLPEALFTAFAERGKGAAELVVDDGSKYRRVFA